MIIASSCFRTSMVKLGRGPVALSAALNLPGNCFSPTRASHDCLGKKPQPNNFPTVTNTQAYGNSDTIWAGGMREAVRRPTGERRVRFPTEFCSNVCPTSSPQCTFSTQSHSHSLSDPSLGPSPRPAHSAGPAPLGAHWAPQSGSAEKEIFRRVGNAQTPPPWGRLGAVLEPS